MKKKILFMVLLAGIMLATPIVAAMPGQEKNNDKFVDFAFTTAGAQGTGNEWQTPPEPADPKTEHGRDVPWLSTAVTITVDGEPYVYTDSSSPISITYEGWMDWDNNIRDKGNVQNVRVTETVTFIEDSEVIGTLEFTVRDQILMSKGRVKGTFVVHGTGVFEGVYASGTDAVISMAPFTLLRAGQVMNWPDIT